MCTPRYVPDVCANYELDHTDGRIWVLVYKDKDTQKTQPIY